MDQAATSEGYDVIGDVHGEAGKLLQLLEVMGYVIRGGVWRHPGGRQAIFVGDLIDRGARQVDTVSLVRDMVEAGSAQMVLGNHEFNAVAFHTPDPCNPGEYLRPHSTKNVMQHETFTDAVGQWSAQHDEFIQWFQVLPLWLDLGGLRVVHACWDPAAIELLRCSVGENNTLTPALLEAASRGPTDQCDGSAEWRAVEHLLKGPEIPLQIPFLDTARVPRSDARFRWWLPSANRLNEAAHLPPNPRTPSKEPYPELSAELIDVPVEPYTDDIPVIYGHYWDDGELCVTSAKTACVDYSAVMGGPLVAYRWSGEAILRNDHFVSSDDI